jgi:hypothetical protein
MGSNRRCSEPSSSTSRSLPIDLPHTSRKIGTHPTITSLEALSLRVTELENALCNQDKLLGKVFHENKKLNLELESASCEIASL